MHKVCRLVILSGRVAERGAEKKGSQARIEHAAEACGAAEARGRFQIVLPRRRLAEDVSATVDQDVSEIPNRSTTPTGPWTPDTMRVAPGPCAGLPLLEAADTQQATLRDGDRASQHGQVVTCDHLRERSGHGRRRLIRWPQYEDPGVAARRVGPDVAQSPIQRDQNRPVATAAASTCGSVAPARFSSTT